MIKKIQQDINEALAAPCFNNPDQDTAHGWADAVSAKLKNKDLNSQIAALSKLNPWINYFHIFKEWALVIGCIALNMKFKNPFLYVVSILFIASRQHAISLLAHEASHYRLFPNRKINDFMSNWFCNFALFYPIERFRHDHVLHHRHVGSEKDTLVLARNNIPKLPSPCSKAKLISVFLRDLLGMGSTIWVAIVFMHTKTFLDWEVTYPKKGWKRYYKKIEFWLFWALWLSVIGYFHLWQPFLLLWVLPLFSTFNFFQKMRFVADHYGLKGEHDYNISRNVYLKWYDFGWFFQPYNIAYHLDHHLWPSVPWYNVPQLHALLLTDPVYRDKAHISHGYFNFGPQGVFGEIMRGGVR
ncbi:fatty acid desaturase family protein [bacterium]|nr:fatty acid desaturase family protein [bacterium]